MKCAFSKELLALYIEADLSEPQLEKVESHLRDCAECEEFCIQLADRQSLLKSLRRQNVSPTALLDVRQSVMSRVGGPKQTLGWAVRLERLLMLGYRRPRYAITAMGILAIVSVSLLGQMRLTLSGYLIPEAGEPKTSGGPAAAIEARAAPPPASGTVFEEPAAVFEGAVFEGKDTLVRPAGYRQWVLAGASMGTGVLRENGLANSHDAGYFHNVYIDPVAFSRYSETGEFPEGTVMVRETATSELRREAGPQAFVEREFVKLEASVKDRTRFEGGWGYFSFTQTDGTLKPWSRALSEESGCKSCHESGADTDHVFTQFYPILRAAGTTS